MRALFALKKLMAINTQFVAKLNVIIGSIGDALVLAKGLKCIAT
jgi:hypothetical protein